MEDFTFDVNAILSAEEAENAFKESEQDPIDKTEEVETDEETTEKETETERAEKGEEPSEKVGAEEETKGDAGSDKSGGSSPDNVYSSIAEALKNDGIFPDFDENEIASVKDADSFAELFEKAITARVDERVNRVNAALENGVDAGEVRKYEQTLQYLDSITEDILSSEDEQGENIRRQLIYNDLITRGYSDEKARREVEKSFKSASDIDDAKDALEALTRFYTANYKKLQDEAEDAKKAQANTQRENTEKYRKMILEDELRFGNTTIDKRTCQKVYDATAKPVYKDPKTGHLLTQVQKFQQENPLEFLKQLGLWYVLTDGGKNTSGIIKEQVRAEKNKSIKELERKINTTPIGTDGALHFSTGIAGNDDTLLNDGWEIGRK